jgi:Rrf2 family protein
MLSQKARYALHALIVLAEHGDSEPIMIAEIADEARVPRKFLEQILLDLKRRGIVRSLRGRAGGYLLGRQPKNITFAEVIRTIDGPLALSPCVSTTAYHKCEDCDDEETCAIRKVLLAARDATAAILEERTLAGAIPSRRRARAAA